MDHQSRELDADMVVLSNRLPVVIKKDDTTGDWIISPGAGGLVTAMAPILKQNHGLWIGWPGGHGDAPVSQLLNQLGDDEGYSLYPINLSEKEVNQYYWGFSNETLWPLCHDLLGYCNFKTDDWQAYQDVNRKFATTTAGLCADKSSLIWVHDYQLTMVGSFLKEMGLGQTIAYFHHIPFPTLDLFRRLPWKVEIIRAMLRYDLLGFQTLRDRRNFVNVASTLLSDVEIISRARSVTVLRQGDRIIRVGHFPISIDFDAFSQAAESHDVNEAAWYLHENLQERQLVLGLDRLDYTKGIPERFLAFERALEKYPELKENISLLQIVVPSRTLVPDYQDLKATLDGMAGRINARFGESGWIPIHYLFRSLNHTQLLAHYRAAEIALVTPLRDGMNLVAKEYCACSTNNKGILILSEFAGAADQLGKDALLVNPYDIDKTADAIYKAFCMDDEERNSRMHNLRTQIRRHNVYRWMQTFLRACRRQHTSSRQTTELHK